MEQFFGKETFALGFALIGVATIALLVSNAKGTTSIIESAGNTFNGLLRTVTLQSNVSNPFNRY